MDHGPKIAQVASLVGEPARANMLASLMAGRALTASELAYHAGVSPQTASGHLAKLSDAGLLVLERQGRHRYFRLASPLVAQMLEGLMVVAQDSPARHRNPWRHGEALRTARTCYDHMAGRIAVGIAHSLNRKSLVVLDADGGMVTEAGVAFLHDRGIALPVASGRRVFCRPCLDWSERRPHIAGTVGAAMLAHAIAQGWVARAAAGRALEVRPHGRQALAALFDMDVPTTA